MKKKSKNDLRECLSDTNVPIIEENSKKKSKKSKSYAGEDDEEDVKKIRKTASTPKDSHNNGHLITKKRTSSFSEKELSDIIHMDNNTTNEDKRKMLRSSGLAFRNKPNEKIKLEDLTSNPEKIPLRPLKFSSDKQKDEMGSKIPMTPHLNNNSDTAKLSRSGHIDTTLPSMFTHGSQDLYPKLLREGKLPNQKDKKRRSSMKVISGLFRSSPSTSSSPSVVSIGSPLNNSSPLSSSSSSPLSQSQGAFSLATSLSSFRSLEMEKRKQTKGSEKEKITKLQSWIRSHFALSVRSQIGSSLQISKRYSALQQMINNEKKYVELLQIIVEGYLTPLKAQIKPQSIPSLPNDAIHAIFFNIEEIYQFHTSFLNALTTRIESYPLFNVGRYLEEQFPIFLRIYAKLAGNISTSEKFIDQWSCKQNFRKFLENNLKIYYHSDAPSFRKLISFPSKHLLTYEPIVKQILFHTPSHTNHFKSMVRSTSIITQLTRYMKHHIESEDLNIFATLFESNSGKKVELSAPKRSFIRDGSLSLNSSPKICFLFTDLLIISGSKGKTRYKVDEMISLKSSKVTGIQSSEDDKIVYSKFTYLLPNHRSVSVEVEEGGKFETSFTKTLDEYVRRNNDPIFAAPIQSLLDRDQSPVPMIVLKSIYHLDKCQNKEGLFRTPGNPLIVSKIRLEETDGGNDFNSIHRDDIASVLLLYLDLLPDPIILFDCSDAVYSTTLPSDKVLLLFLERNITNMNEATRNLIEYLAYFLQRLSSTSIFSTYELSLFFAPLIIRSKEVSSIDYCHSAPIIIKIVDLLIRRSENLFRSRSQQPLPQSMRDFFLSDNFGVWWKSFRSKEKSFVKFITRSESFSHLFSYLLLLPIADPLYNNNQIYNGEDKEKEERERFSNLSVNVLTNDWVTDHLLDQPNLLDQFFFLLKSKDISEIAMKNFCEVAHSLFAKKKEQKIIGYLVADQSDVTAILISQIGSGNISSMLTKVMELANDQPDLCRVLTKWANYCLGQLMSDEYSSESSNFQHIAQYIIDLLHHQHYVLSPHSSSFLHQLHQICETSNLFEKAISSESRETGSILISVIISVITKKLVYVQKQSSLGALQSPLSGSSPLRDDDSLNRPFPDPSFSQIKEELKQSIKQISVLENPVDDDNGDDDNNIDNNNNDEVIGDGNQSSSSPSSSSSSLSGFDILNNNNKSIGNHLSSPPLSPISKSSHSPSLQPNDDEDKDDEDNEDEDENNDMLVNIYKTPLFQITQQKDVDLSNTLLTALIMQHKRIEEVITHPTPYLGALKLSLLQLTQALISISSPIINDQLPNTGLLNACFHLFSAHPLCNIAHCIVRDIVLFLIKGENELLLSHLFTSTSLLPLIFSSFSQSEVDQSSVKCHFEVIKNAMEKSQVAITILKTTSHWPTLIALFPSFTDSHLHNTPKRSRRQKPS